MKFSQKLPITHLTRGGTGKTYASAFAMRELGFKRVLFLVHRASLAVQAKKSYQRVFGSTISVGLVGAGYHEYDRDYIFATVETLNRDVQNFLKAKERGIHVELFVRKNKDDKISKEFYYLGHMTASGKTKEFKMANTEKTAVEIEWILDVPVREDIYEYIVNS